jgi:hypothetical protein
MPDTSVFGMKFVPELDKQGMGKVTRAIQDGLRGNILDASTAKRFQSMAASASKEFNSTIAKAKMVGLDDSANTWRSTMLKTQDDLVKAITDMEKMKERVGKDLTQAAYNAHQKQVKEKFETQNMLLSMEMKGVEAVIDKRKQALDDWERTKADGVGKSMAGGFSDAMGDMWSNVKSKDLGGLGKALGGALKKGSAGLDTASAAGAAGGAGEGMAAMSGMMAGAATALAVIAGVVVAVGAVIAVLVAADEQAKDFNTTLMDGASQADFFSQSAVTGVNDLTGSLNAARDAAIDLAWEFRGDTKEILGVMSAANEAGLTFKEMQGYVGGNVTEMEAYQSVAKQALVWSKTLGVSMTDATTQGAKWAHDLGGGQKTVDDGFKAIFAGAQQSGIGVKRFYSMVTSATSNMALYNIRIEEAAALISTLGKSLGEANAASFAEGLSKGFAAESYTDRFKRLMIAGKGDMAEIMENSAVNTADAFKKKFGAVVGPAMQDAAKQGGVDMNLALSGAAGSAAELAKLGKMSERQTRDLLGAAKSPEERRELEKLVELSRGMSGSIGDQAKAMDGMSMSDKLATILSGGLGGKAISEMSGMQLAAFENYSGLSGEQLVELRKVDRQLRGQYDVISDANKAGKEASASQKKKLEELGFEMRDGKVYSKETDRLIDSYSDMIQSQGGDLADSIASPMSEQEALAKQTVANTASMLNSIDTGLIYVMEKVADLLQAFYDAWQGTSAEQRAFTAALVKDSQRTQAGLKDTIVEQKGYLAEAQKDVDTAGSAEERDAAKVRVAELEGIVGEKETYLATEQERESEYRTGGSAKQLEAKYAGGTTADMTARGFGRIGSALGFETDVGNDYESYAVSSAAEAGRQQRESRAEDAIPGPSVSSSISVEPGDTELGESIIESSETSDGRIDAFATSSSVEAGKLLGEAEDQTSAIDDLAGSRVEDGVKIGEILEMKKVARTVTGGATKGKEFDDVMRLLGQSGGMDKVSAKYGDREGVEAALGEFGHGASIGKGGGGGGGDDDTRVSIGSGPDGGEIYSDGTGDNIENGDPMNDFIYRGGAMGGTITAINSADDLLGAKSGGAIDKMMGKGGGGGGGNRFVFHINGGDTAKVYAVVKKALRESGIRPPPGTG